MSLKYKKELCNNLKKLKEISDLKDNWNDNNAKKFLLN